MREDGTLKNGCRSSKLNNRIKIRTMKDQIIDSLISSEEEPEKGCCLLYALFMFICLIMFVVIHNT